MPDKQQVGIEITGSIAESMKQAVAQVKQMLAELHGMADIPIGGRAVGGGGSTAAHAGYGGRVRVGSTVARSTAHNNIAPGSPPLASMTSPLGGGGQFGMGAWTSAGQTSANGIVDRTIRYSSSDKQGIKQWREDYVADNKFGSMSNFEEWITGVAKSNAPMYRFGRGALAAVGYGGAAMLNAEANSALTGHPDRMGRASAAAEMVGGIGGALIGALAFPMNPFAPLIGMNAGSQVAGGISRFVNADQESTIRAVLGNLEGGRIHAGMMGDYRMYSTPGFQTPQPTASASGPALTGRIPASIVHAKQLQEWIGEKRIATKAGDTGSGILGSIQQMYGPKYEDFLPTKESLASAYQSISSGLLEGGIDPTMPYGEEPVFGTERYVKGYKRVPGQVRSFNARAGGLFGASFGRQRGGAGGNVGRVVDLVGAAVSNWPIRGEDTWEPEYGERQVMTGTKASELGKWLTHNLALHTGVSVDDAAKTLNPMLHAIPSIGGSVRDIYSKTAAGVNAADLLGKFGVGGASAFMQAWTPVGQTPAVTMQMFRQTQQDVLESRYGQEKAGLQIRSSATSQIAPIESEMQAWARLPGGRDSLEYAKGRRRLQGAVLGSYEESDLSGYSMDQMRFEQAGKRMDLLPFSPGNRYGYALEGVSRNRRRIGQLRGRERDLRSRGLLDERTEFALESNIEDLTTSSYAQIATIVDGAANRIPALSAGGIAGTSRFDSMQLAALNLNNMGHPGGRYGAASGRQARGTARFFEQMIGGPMPPGFGHAENSPLGSNNADTQAIVRLLERLVNAAEKGSNPQKPYRGPGELAPTGSHPIPGT